MRRPPPPRRRRRRIALVALSAALAACADDPVAPRSIAPRLSEGGSGSDGRGVFHRYVAIGTSISMGWQSDGAIAATQETSWPAQLARMAEREITQPYLDGTGCRSPLLPPLASGVRLSGEAAGAPASSLSCSELREGIVLPTQNVAINAAKAHDALFTTPENVTDAANSRLYARILAPGQTQVSAMEAQNPKIVSVELGGNDLLDARSGIAIPGVTITPFNAWAQDYDAILDRVGDTSKMAILVGLIDDVASFPSFRRGAEIWADRAMLYGAFNVAVHPECEHNDNLIFVAVRIPVAVATGAAFRQRGLGPFTFRCADGGLGAQDFVLTPADVAVINTHLALMNAHIRSEAEQRGYAYFELQALYGQPGLKGAFSSLALMTSAQPYGPLISLDGIHPTAAGSQMLAEAAARAVNERYNLGIPVGAATAAVFADR